MINYTKLSVVLTCMEDAYLPQYLGSTLRGALGKELRNMCCTEDFKKDCIDCLKKSNCCYSYAFYNLHGSIKSPANRIETAPNPFVIEPPLDKKQTYRAGDELEFNLVVIGNSNEFLPNFIYSLHNMAENGLGAQRRKFKLKRILDYHTKGEVYKDGRYNGQEISSVHCNTSFAVGDIKEIKISFHTPFRFIFNRKLEDSLNFEIFIRNVFRRISLLSTNYCDSELNIDFKKYLEMARGITVKNADIYWHDWKRYSNRQKAEIKMGGILGKVTFKGTLTPFMPFISIGSIVHIGKGCTMGLGEYQWEVHMLGGR